jgi:hypothetical protein
MINESKEKLEHARHALDGATSENIVELCKQYLEVLADYREQLYELANSGFLQESASSLSKHNLAAARKSFRTAIEKATHERNRTEMLLLSITKVSGYEAVEVLNQRNYEGHSDWELRASGVKSSASSAHDLMTIQEAVDLVCLLRREDHVAQNMAQS